MRLVKFLIVIVVLLGGIGYGAYHFGTKYASNKLVQTVYTELENSGQLKDIRKIIDNDPKLKSFIENAETADGSNLPFTTKEEATKVLIKKLGISKLNEIRQELQDGTASKKEILNEIESKLSKEEIEALKVIAYKELYY